jgi:hypothetical protein
MKPMSPITRQKIRLLEKKFGPFVIFIFLIVFGLSVKPSQYSATYFSGGFNADSPMHHLSYTTEFSASSMAN